MLFVDDILLFFNGSVRDITKLKNTLSLFIEATYIMWKPLILDFGVIGYWIAWDIGNRRRSG